jgi:hypothetical protein
MYAESMADRSSRHPEDANETAFSVLQQVIGEKPKEKPPQVKKNPAAVSLGRLGGLKGGKARANALTPEKRKEIAKKAAAKRWKSKE